MSSSYFNMRNVKQNIPGLQNSRGNVQNHPEQISSSYQEQTQCSPEQKYYESPSRFDKYGNSSHSQETLDHSNRLKAETQFRGQPQSKTQVELKTGNHVNQFMTEHDYLIENRPISNERDRYQLEECERQKRSKSIQEYYQVNPVNQHMQREHHQSYKHGSHYNPKFQEEVYTLNRNEQENYQQSQNLEHRIEELSQEVNALKSSQFSSPSTNQLNISSQYRKNNQENIHQSYTPNQRENSYNQRENSNNERDNLRENQINELCLNEDWNHSHSRQSIEQTLPHAMNFGRKVSFHQQLTQEYGQPPNYEEGLDQTLNAQTGRGFFEKLRQKVQQTSKRIEKTASKVGHEISKDSAKAGKAVVSAGKSTVHAAAKVGKEVGKDVVKAEQVTVKGVTKAAVATKDGAVFVGSKTVQVGKKVGQVAMKDLDKTAQLANVVIETGANMAGDTAEELGAPHVVGQIIKTGVEVVAQDSPLGIVINADAAVHAVKDPHEFIQQVKQITQQPQLLLTTGDEQTHPDQETQHEDQELQNGDQHENENEENKQPDFEGSGLNVYGRNEGYEENINYSGKGLEDESDWNYGRGLNSQGNPDIQKSLDGRNLGYQGRGLDENEEFYEGKGLNQVNQHGIYEGIYEGKGLSENRNAVPQAKEVIGLIGAGLYLKLNATEGIRREEHHLHRKIIELDGFGMGSHGNVQMSLQGAGMQLYTQDNETVDSVLKHPFNASLKFGNRLNPVCFNNWNLDLPCIPGLENIPQVMLNVNRVNSRFRLESYDKKQVQDILEELIKSNQIIPEPSFKSQTKQKTQAVQQQSQSQPQPQKPLTGKGLDWGEDLTGNGAATSKTQQMSKPKSTALPPPAYNPTHLSNNSKESPTTITRYDKKTPTTQPVQTSSQPQISSQSQQNSQNQQNSQSQQKQSQPTPPSNQPNQKIATTPSNESVKKPNNSSSSSSSSAEVKPSATEVKSNVVEAKSNEVTSKWAAKYIQSNDIVCFRLYYGSQASRQQIHAFVEKNSNNAVLTCYINELIQNPKYTYVGGCFISGPNSELLVTNYDKSENISPLFNKKELTLTMLNPTQCLLSKNPVTQQTVERNTSMLYQIGGYECQILVVNAEKGLTKCSMDDKLNLVGEPLIFEVMEDGVYPKMCKMLYRSEIGEKLANQGLTYFSWSNIMKEYDEKWKVQFNSFINQGDYGIEDSKNFELQNQITRCKLGFESIREGLEKKTLKSNETQAKKEILLYQVILIYYKISRQNHTFYDQPDTPEVRLRQFQSVYDQLVADFGKTNN